MIECACQRETAFTYRNKCRIECRVVSRILHADLSLFPPLPSFMKVGGQVMTTDPAVKRREKQNMKDDKDIIQLVLICILESSGAKARAYATFGRQDLC